MEIDGKGGAMPLKEARDQAVMGEFGAGKRGNRERSVFENRKGGSASKKLLTHSRK